MDFIKPHRVGQYMTIVRAHYISVFINSFKCQQSLFQLDPRLSSLEYYFIKISIIAACSVRCGLKIISYSNTATLVARGVCDAVLLRILQPSPPHFYWWIHPLVISSVKISEKYSSRVVVDRISHVGSLV